MSARRALTTTITSLVLAVLGVFGAAHVRPDASGAAVPGGAGSPAPARPNIVFVLTDDLSGDLLRFMPHVRRLQRDGMSFTNYYVTDSLCCPSRATIFTGQFPHNTGVLGNVEPTGGFSAFLAHGDERRTFSIGLENDGYRTGMMGKYLNRYEPQSRYVPPGWSSWAVPGWGYPEYHYTLNVDGRLQKYGGQPRSYLTNVLARRGARFIDEAAFARQPFMLELSTFAPHRPATPAPQDRRRFPDLRAPHGPAYDRAVTDPPKWLRGHPRLNPFQKAAENIEFRKRARSVLAVDRMVGRLRAQLRALGIEKNTYFVFSSDNGYHLGQHRLVAGKMTAFDDDIRVPLILAGPGIAPGSTNADLTENVDLAPTFLRLAGRPVPDYVDGHALGPLLHGRAVRDWRDAVLVEHHRAIDSGLDPDQETRQSGSPPTYDAIRMRTGVYVEYIDGSREYYYTRTDPHELQNVYGSLPPGEQARLHRVLRRLVHCHGGTSCWRAGHLRPPGPLLDNATAP